MNLPTLAKQRQEFTVISRGRYHKTMSRDHMTGRHHGTRPRDDTTGTRHGTTRSREESRPRKRMTRTPTVSEPTHSKCPNKINTPTLSSFFFHLRPSLTNLLVGGLRSRGGDELTLHSTVKVVTFTELRQQARETHLLIDVATSGSLLPDTAQDLHQFVDALRSPRLHKCRVNISWNHRGWCSCCLVCFSCRCLCVSVLFLRRCSVQGILVVTWCKRFMTVKLHRELVTVQTKRNLELRCFVECGCCRSWLLHHQSRHPRGSLHNANLFVDLTHPAREDSGSGERPGRSLARRWRRWRTVLGDVGGALWSPGGGARSGEGAGDHAWRTEGAKKPTL